MIDVGTVVKLHCDVCDKERPFVVMLRPYMRGYQLLTMAMCCHCDMLERVELVEIEVTH